MQLGEPMETYPLDNIYKLNTEDNKKTDVYLQIIILIFITIKLIFYRIIGPAPAAKYLALILVAILTSTFTEFIYYKYLCKKSNNELLKILSITSPQIPGLMIGCILNFGYSFPSVVICTFLGLFIARLVFADFPKNIFNPIAFTFVLFHSGYRHMVENPSMNNIMDKAFLDYFHSTNVYSIQTISNIKNNFPADVSIGSSLPYILLATVFIFLSLLLFQIKTFNFLPALFIGMFLFLMSYSFMGFSNAMVEIQIVSLGSFDFFKNILDLSGSFGHYIKSVVFFFKLIIGPTILGILLVSTNSNFISENKVVVVINSFIIALTIFYTKIFTDNSYGIFFGIILSNLITPMLDVKVKESKGRTDAAVILLIFMSLISGFISFWAAMKGF